MKLSNHSALNGREKVEINYRGAAKCIQKYTFPRFPQATTIDYTLFTQISLEVFLLSPKNFLFLLFFGPAARLRKARKIFFTSLYGKENFLFATFSRIFSLKISTIATDLAGISRNPRGAGGFRPRMLRITQEKFVILLC
jgi:hypothetical protein